EQGESADYIYSIDYRTLENDAEEYFELFQDAGWSLVDSSVDIHLFRAAPHTKPIYTDRDTTIEKYKNQTKPLNITMMTLVPATIITWVISLKSTGNIHTLFFCLALLLTVLTIPLLWTALTSYGNPWKAEYKKGLVLPTKLLPAISGCVASFLVLASLVCCMPIL